MVCIKKEPLTIAMDRGLLTNVVNRERERATNNCHGDRATNNGVSGERESYQQLPQIEG